MSQDTKQSDRDALKKARLAEALKANLRRRKDQMRARNKAESSKPLSDSQKDSSKR